MSKKIQIEENELAKLVESIKQLTEEVIKLRSQPQPQPQYIVYPVYQPQPYPYPVYVPDNLFPPISPYTITCGQTTSNTYG